MIPILSRRAGGGKKKPEPPPKATAPSPPAQKKEQPQKAAAAAPPPSAKPSTKVAATTPAPPPPPPPPKFDPTQHVLSCLAAFSRDLAAGASSANDSAALPTLIGAAHTSVVAAKSIPSSSASDSSAGDEKLKQLLHRRRFLERAATRIGRSVVSTACSVKARIRSTGRKKSKKSAAAAKKEETTPVVSAATAISGKVRREKRLRYLKGKKQKQQFDRRHLSQLFCLGCGRPRVAGFSGFEVVDGQKKKKNNSEDGKPARKAIRCSHCALRERGLRLWHRVRSQRVPKSSFRSRWKRGRKNVLTRQRFFRAGVAFVGKLHAPWRSEKKQQEEQQQVRIQRCSNRRVAVAGKKKV